ncbi:MAG: hypothetical protein V7L29_26460 [Nostoc sp.]|uniref:hypothetical protein n=1 Tax=Nostoc sp. TaxID=1180 RepID=UPI002FF79CB1
MVNVIAGLIAYTYQEKKPSLNLTIEDLDSLQEADFFLIKLWRLLSFNPPIQLGFCLN